MSWCRIWSLHSRPGQATLITTNKNGASQWLLPAGNEKCFRSDLFLLCEGAGEKREKHTDWEVFMRLSVVVSDLLVYLPGGPKVEQPGEFPGAFSLDTVPNLKLWDEFAAGICRLTRICSIRSEFGLWT